VLSDSSGLRIERVSSSVTRHWWRDRRSSLCECDVSPVETCHQQTIRYRKNGNNTPPAILTAHTDNTMKGFGIQQFVGLLLGVSLIGIGYLGLVGRLKLTSVLVTAGVIVVAVASFFLGRLSVHFENT